MEIVQAPNKVTYTAGEKLDMTGLKVRIYTPDGFIDSKDGKNLTYSQKELVTVGEQKIKISYEDAFEFFIVTVVAAPDSNPDTTTKPTEPNESSKPTDITDGTENPTDGSETPTDGTESTDPTTDTTGANGDQNGKGMPWWGILLIALVAAGAGVGITIFVLKKKKA